MQAALSQVTAQVEPELLKDPVLIRQHPGDGGPPVGGPGPPAGSIPAALPPGRPGEGVGPGPRSRWVPGVAGDGALVARQGVVVASNKRNLIRRLPALQIAAAGIGRGLSPTFYSVQ